jgi:hypothetical protein
MLVSFGGEGSNLYGEPLLENVREAWSEWRKANEVAARYDRKIAGAYLLLHYPSFGQGIDQNGAKLDNVYLAQRILDKLEAASGVAIGDVPSELAPGQDPNQTAWRLEVQGSAGGQQQGFVDRLRYLDSLKVRGMLLPERAILEGQRGTLAESQSQSDLALLQAELVHHHLTREINRQAVDPVLEANWGPAYRGKVRLEAAPLSADNQGFLRQLVTHVLADPKDFADLFRRADWSSIFDAVGLPQTKASTVAPSGPSAILSAVGQLQREAMEEDEGTVSRSPSHRERYSTAGAPIIDVAVESEHVHNEAEAADAILLHNFNPKQPRDTDGKWKNVGSSAASSKATRAEGMLAQGPPPPRVKSPADNGAKLAQGVEVPVGEKKATIRAQVEQKTFTWKGDTIKTDEALKLTVTSHDLDVRGVDVVQFVFRLYGKPDSEEEYQRVRYKDDRFDPAKGPLEDGVTYMSSQYSARPHWQLDNVGPQTATATKGYPGVEKDKSVLKWWDAPDFPSGAENTNVEQRAIYEAYVVSGKHPVYRLHWERKRSENGQLSYPSDRRWGVRVDAFDNSAMRALNKAAGAREAPASEGEFWAGDKNYTPALEHKKYPITNYSNEMPQ